MARGQDPFNTQVRGFVKQVHGIDLAAPPPDVRPLVDYGF